MKQKPGLLSLNNALYLAIGAVVAAMVFWRLTLA